LAASTTISVVFAHTNWWAFFFWHKQAALEGEMEAR
jgi:hypothetical protein